MKMPFYSFDGDETVVAGYVEVEPIRPSVPLSVSRKAEKRERMRKLYNEIRRRNPLFLAEETC